MSFLGDLWDGMKDVKDRLESKYNPNTLMGQLNLLTGGGLGLTDFAIQGSQSNWDAIKHAIIPDMRRDREAMTNSGTASRRLVYGRTRVGGSLVYAETSGATNEYLNMVVILAGHIVDGYEEIWFNDKKAATVAAGVVTVETDFIGFVTFELHDGTQTTASAGMLAVTAGNWTADHKLLGCAYMYVKLTYSETVYASGIPQIKVVMRGKKVYDPQTLTTAWSDNPALCIRDYMLLPVSQGGMGCDSSEVSDTHVISAKAICNELTGPAYTALGITIHTGEKRYTLNGYLDLEGTPASFLQPMISAMAGQALYSGGVWRIYAGAATTSVATIDESWLNGSVSFQSGSNKGGKINTVKGTFTNPADHYGDTEFPTVVIDSYVAEDYEELTLDMSLPYTNSPTMAQRLAFIAIQKSRYGMSVEYPCNMKAAQLNAMDTVAINNDLLGWSGKLFKVLSWDFSAQGGVNLSLVEDAAAIWLDPDDYGALNPPVLTNLPNPWAVAPPTSLTATESLYFGNVASNIKSKLALSWVSGDQSGTLYDIYFGFVGNQPLIATTTDTAYTIMDLAPGAYIVSVSARNSLGAASTWTSIYITVLGKRAPPPDVATFLVRPQQDGTRQFAWSMASIPLDMAGYKIKWNTGDAIDWSIMSDLHSGLLLASPFETNQLAAGDYIFGIKAVDTTGNESLNALFVTTTLPNQRLANVWSSSLSMDGSWPGIATDCSIMAEGVLEANDTGTWDTWPSTWDTATAWKMSPVSPISYATPSIDLGIELYFEPQVMAYGTGAISYQMAVSFDGISWGAWSTLSKVSSRYVKFLITVTATSPTICVLQSVQAYLVVKPIIEEISDLDTSTVTGVRRIGTGDIRIALVNQYDILKQVSVTLQNTGPGWTWELIDKDIASGPRIKIYDNTQTLADAVIDAYIKGV